jgi:hypothetical protein
MAQNLLLIALVLVVIWLLRKMFPGGTQSLYGRAKGTGATSAHNHAYEAVSIHCYTDRCAAAEQVAGQRFLAREAPPLPLASCTSAKCHCVYMHHVDRRGGTDRRVIHPLREPVPSASGYQNRRNSRGRRASDPAVA